MKNTSVLVSFYSGKGEDGHRRRLCEILVWNDRRLEHVHDYIQWLFPLAEASRINAKAPILKQEDIAAFRSDAELRANLLRSFLRMLGFYGFAMTYADGHALVQRTKRFESRSLAWLTGRNHNFLRISRILRSLALLGLKPEAEAFLKILEEIYRNSADIIGEETLGYWRMAVR